MSYKNLAATQRNKYRYNKSVNLVKYFCKYSVDISLNIEYSRCKTSEISLVVKKVVKYIS